MSRNFRLRGQLSHLQGLSCKGRQHGAMGWRRVWMDEPPEASWLIYPLGVALHSVSRLRPMARLNGADLNPKTEGGETE